MFRPEVFKSYGYITDLLFYNKIKNAIKKGINESLHIVENFDKCINDIIDIWLLTNGHLSRLIFTNWYFDINTGNCYKNIKNTNINTDYAIFINYYGDHNELALHGYNAIRGIDLDINDKKIIVGYNIFHGNKDIIKYRLKHEFTHVREQYIEEQKNIIFNKKNMSTDIDISIINKLLNDNNDVIQVFTPKLFNILYFLSPTELHARINEFYEFAKNIKLNDLLFIDILSLSMAQVIEEFIKNKDEINLTITFIDAWEYIKLDDLLVLILGYYLNDRHLCKLNITKFNIRDILKDTIRLEKIKNNIDYKLKRIYVDYFNKLIDIAVKAFKENKIYNKIIDILFT